jgi:ribosomal protein S18 acetylase RimI-like enzyme
MEIRQAESADSPAIRDVARRSLRESYSLETGTIANAVTEWYAEEELATRMDSDDTLLLVAEREQKVVGFSQIACSDEEATILWLHVDPAHRGEGVGSGLYEGTREHLGDLDHLYGRVLADNADGNDFYDSQGFEQVGEDSVEIGDESYTEHVWADTDADVIEPIEADGRTLYVDRHESDTGSKGHFHVVYSDTEEEDIYGYYCANCEGLANAMDAMGRVECDNCGNTRKPTRWDAAYL